MNKWLGSEDDEASEIPQRPAPKMDRGMLIFLLLALAVLAGTAYLPAFLRANAELPPVEALGPVQRVSYLGGLGTWTQVELPGRTVLLKRAVELDVGTEVVRRRGMFAEALCVEGTKRCFDLASR